MPGKVGELYLLYTLHIATIAARADRSLSSACQRRDIAAMASLFSGIYHSLMDPITQISFATVLLIIILVAYVTLSFTELSYFGKAYNAVCHYSAFAYSCFLKPHSGDGSGSQQDALESFYKSQASIYDATRTRLLQGREDMLALVAAQVKHRRRISLTSRKPIWVDIGGGTGWNIEQMQTQLDVPSFFHAVYLVDLSSSLCEIAQQRFRRLGWKNVHVICQDARMFRLSDYEAGVDESQREFSIGKSAYDEDARDYVGADLLTMSYSLSMIPNSIQRSTVWPIFLPRTALSELSTSTFRTRSSFNPATTWVVPLTGIACGSVASSGGPGLNLTV